MHLKGKYYKEYMAQYKRRGTGKLEGIAKFIIFTKTYDKIRRLG
jgi:hypothetical protein